jgi:ABC-type uncharacterized transport system substrate-binding protein
MSARESYVRARFFRIRAACVALPTVDPYRQFAEVGGLLSYGNDLSDNYRRAGGYADCILRGEKPGELPVQVPVKFELVINLKTAKALGVPVGNSHSDILVVQSAQDWHGQHATDGLGRARDWRVLVQ